MKYNNIVEFINFGYKKIDTPMQIANLLVVTTICFLTVLFHRKIGWAIGLGCTFTIAYFLILALSYKLHDEKKRKFLVQGSFYVCFCISCYVFIAGFVQQKVMFFVFEISLLILMQVFMIFMCCIQMRKGVYKDSQKFKLSPIVPVFGILGIVLGRFILSFIEIPNQWALYFLILVILLLSTGTSDLLRLGLTYVKEQKISNRFIMWLENEGN